MVQIFPFSEACLEAVVPSYLPIIARHKNDSFTEDNKRWQQMRRGLYVEYNLVYDRCVWDLVLPPSKKRCMASLWVL